jgi:hypothetical protein
VWWRFRTPGLIDPGIPVMFVVKIRDMPWNHPIQSLPAIAPGRGDRRGLMDSPVGHFTPLFPDSPVRR